MDKNELQKYKKHINHCNNILYTKRNTGSGFLY